MGFKTTSAFENQSLEARKEVLDEKHREKMQEIQVTRTTPTAPVTQNIKIEFGLLKVGIQTIF